MPRKSTPEKEALDVALATRAAATPVPQVPNPVPPPATRTAPHFAAGVVDEIKRYGSAVDPFTGKTVTAADL